MVRRKFLNFFARLPRRTIFKVQNKECDKIIRLKISRDGPCTNLDDGEHASSVLGDDHLIGEVLELGPELRVFQFYAGRSPPLHTKEYYKLREKYDELSSSKEPNGAF